MTKLLNHINTYADLTAYNNDNDKNYPNIAYIIETNEVKWVKEKPDLVVCKYNVTSTSNPTNLISQNKTNVITYQIIDDVKQDTVQATYTFDTLGEHTVKYKLDGTSIGDSAFQYITSLTSITIPNSVTSIGNFAFNNCSGLTSVNIPNSVTSIGEGAFYYCTGLTSIKVESGNSVYDSRENCNAIIETATNILISGCNNTIIPNSVTSIGGFAFSGCSGLTSVTIGNSVTSIGDQAFSGCSGLTSVTIPNSVTSIGDMAFSNCSGLTSVTIPNSVTSIGNSAFESCSGLTSITIPNSITSIGDMAFGNCSGLTSVTIPNSVTSIGNYAFSGCSGLTSVTIPNSVTSIGEEAFSYSSGLTSVTIHATTPPTLANTNAFEETHNCPIYVPAESLDAYVQSGNWGLLVDRIQPIPTE